MIARTLLTPEDSTNAGVRFQFIQNEVIRVQKDDIIATFTDKGQDAPCDQLVSVHHTIGINTLTVNIGINNFKINDTRQLPRNGDFGFRNANPALKAYVSGMCASLTFVGQKLKTIII